MNELPRLEEAAGGGVLLWIKAVPGASRNQIAGVLGERLKVRVAAAPEAGKANQAICETLAAALKIKPKQVALENGQTNAEKIVRITGITMPQLKACIAEILQD